MTSILVTLLLVGTGLLGIWLQLRPWAGPRVYFGPRLGLADCVLREPRRLEVSRD